MCIVFLNTDVFRLPSSSGVTRMSRKGMDPSFLVSSQANWILLGSGPLFPLTRCKYHKIINVITFLRY